MGDGVGDTPQTAMTTRAPAVLKKLTDRQGGGEQVMVMIRIHSFFDQQNRFVF